MTISSAPSGLVAFIVTPPRLKPGLSSQGPSGRNRLQSPTGSWAKFPGPFGPKPAPKSDRFLGYVFKALRAETGFKVGQVPGLCFQGPSGRNRLQSPTGSWAMFSRPFGPKPASKFDRFLGYVFKALRAETGSEVRQVPGLCFQALRAETGSKVRHALGLCFEALRAETGSKVRQAPGLCFQGPSGRNRRSRSLSVKRLRRIADSK
jgi:hypothetical protein